MENTRSRDTGGYGEKICEPCDDCYNLVQNAANQHRDNLDALDSLLQQIAENPEPLGDDFVMQLRKLQVRVKTMVVEAKVTTEDEEGGTLKERLKALAEKLDAVLELVEKTFRK